jgi:hypothetical protein
MIRDKTAVTTLNALAEFFHYLVRFVRVHY